MEGQFNYGRALLTSFMLWFIFGFFVIMWDAIDPGGHLITAFIALSILLFGINAPIAVGFIFRGGSNGIDNRTSV